MRSTTAPVAIGTAWLVLAACSGVPASPTKSVAPTIEPGAVRKLCADGRGEPVVGNRLDGKKVEITDSTPMIGLAGPTEGRYVVSDGELLIQVVEASTRICDFRLGILDLALRVPVCIKPGEVILFDGRVSRPPAQELWVRQAVRPEWASSPVFVAETLGGRHVAVLQSESAAPCRRPTPQPSVLQALLA